MSSVEDVTFSSSIDESNSDKVIDDEPKLMLNDPPSNIPLISSSSDSEGGDSWIILDDDEDEANDEDEVGRRELKSEEGITPRTDITDNLDSLPSIGSDGYPIIDEAHDEEIEDDNQQYVWEDEPSLTGSCEHTPTTEKPPPIFPDNLTPAQIGEILTSYPYMAEELPDQYAQIVKGRTYEHRPNKKLSLMLNGSIILVVAMVVGLGCGHFLGWSERLELHELYDDVRDDKMELLQDNLVSCMTKETSEPDLDNKLIQQLWEENRELKEEIDLLKGHQGSGDSIENELTFILRDRINELMTANVDLEREVAKLRYGHQAIQEAETSKEFLKETRETLSLTTSDLVETKNNLNDVSKENELLKIAIAKARYAKPQIPLEEKEKINILTTENLELKEEVRKIRYGPSSNCKVIEDDASENTSKSADNSKSSSSSFVKNTDHYVKILRNFFNETQTEAKKVIEPVKHQVYQQWNEIKSFAKKVKKDVKESVVGSRMNKTKEVVKNLGNLVVSKFHDLKLYGEELINEKYLKKSKKNKKKNKNNYHKSSSKVIDENDLKIKKKNKKRGHHGKKSRKNTTLNWYDKRNKNREFIRDEESKADWMFDRASDREKIHKVTGSDWHSRKYYMKECGYDCEDIIDVSNHHYQDDNPTIRSRKNSEDKNDDFDDDDDDDEDDIDFYMQSEYKNRRKYKKSSNGNKNYKSGNQQQKYRKNTKKYEKRQRYNNDHHHVRKNNRGNIGPNKKNIKK